MRIGIALELHGPAPGDEADPSRWSTIYDSVRAAEDAGFDLVVVEDVFLGESSDQPTGAWESVAVLGGIATSTATIGIGHSMLNAPYRPPALVASIATTLDEMSDGRYVLGLGAGNTSDDDYEALGLPTDHRYGRFAEGLEIIHGLLKHGKSELQGKHHAVQDAALLMRGPRAAGPPIVLGARGPKMMRLAAQYADEWNANAYLPQTVDAFRPMVEELERACTEVGRETSTLRRSIDLVVHAPDIVSGAAPSKLGQYLVNGTRGEIAEKILSFQELGFAEARCYLQPMLPPAQRAEAIRSMSDIVQQVQRD